MQDSSDEVEQVISHFSGSYATLRNRHISKKGRRVVAPAHYYGCSFSFL